MASTPGNGTGSTSAEAVTPAAEGAQQPDAVGEAAAKKSNREHEKSTADLHKVTDHVEECDIGSTNLTDSMRTFLDKKAKSKSAAIARDRELAKVKIQQADVDTIVEELELKPKTAERALREASGDLVDALCALVD